ncbi:uncharacterized protein Z520_02453 [Fonsecaea multimorphosa CBS 102226]|uniref:Uncharacterized protein n=1 Tax=Fonsecaea multimorphosa CBS 102226 TaxID=1442371 RepID=A0A0D2KFR4_9EURO|nr:uncharacterized protein Z520_02453 [Fonsecaea multimorphosa CBS 102226]KIY02315.1 hypothetical protein Z520_02453 [Fonsecaea multimorphosa CBS 102226]
MKEEGENNIPHRDDPLPAGLTLSEVIALYPRHAWGTMLRVFMSEGLSADHIWRLTPQDMRNTRSITRPWNYIQAVVGARGGQNAIRGDRQPVKDNGHAE